MNLIKRASIGSLKNKNMEFSEYVQSEAEFLESYPKAKEFWDRADTTWKELEEIRSDYITRVPALQGTADAFAVRLQSLPGVHSTRVRVKHPDHLLAKIVRKRTPQRQIDIDNYLAEVTDLIGARALHVFKSEWQSIHRSITETWEPHEEPTAYIREGDDQAIYKSKDVKVHPHPSNYRSVHYGVRTAFTREIHFVEVQVRTIYEEAWGEIDHELRYPDFEGNPYLEKSSALLNLLSGSADELASLIQSQRDEILSWQETEAGLRADNSKKDAELQATKAELAALIGKSAASEEEKQQIIQKIESIPAPERPPAKPRTQPGQGYVESLLKFNGERRQRSDRELQEFIKTFPTVQATLRQLEQQTPKLYDISRQIQEASRTLPNTAQQIKQAQEALKLMGKYDDLWKKPY